MLLVDDRPDGYAQELPKAKKLVDHTWHQVVMVKFNPARWIRLFSLSRNHLAKAWMAAGTTGPQMMQFKTGE